MKELQAYRLSMDSEVLSSVLDQLETKLVDGGGTRSKGSLKVCNTYQALISNDVELSH